MMKQASKPHKTRRASSQPDFFPFGTSCVYQVKSRYVGREMIVTYRIVLLLLAPEPPVKDECRELKYLPRYSMQVIRPTDLPTFLLRLVSCSGSGGEAVGKRLWNTTGVWD